MLSALLGLALGGCEGSLDDAARFEIVKENQLRGNFTAAMLELKNILQANPSNTEARLLLGEVWLAAGRAPAAEKQIRRAVRDGKAPDDVLYPLGLSLLAQGKFQQVLAEVRPRAEGSREQLPVHLLHGMALTQLGRLDEARREFRAALTIEPDTADAWVGLARLELAAGNYAATALAIDKATDANPFSVAAYQTLGSLRFRQRRFKDAQLAFQRAIEATTTTVQGEATLLAHIGLAESLWMLNLRNQALAVVNDLLENYPWHPLPKYERALLAFRGGDFRAVEDHLRQVLLALPDHSDSIRLLAAVKFMQGELESANEHLRNLLDSDPTNAELLTLRAETHLAMGNAGQAMATLRQLDEPADSNPHVVELSATASLHAGQPDKAVEHFTTATRLAPDDPANGMRLAGAYIAAGNVAAASDVLRSVPRDGRTAASLKLLALLKASRTDAPEQIRLRAKALRQEDPSSLHAMITLAEVSHRENKPELAIEWLELALHRNPASLEAALLLVRSLEEAGDLPKARQAALDAARQHPNNADALAALARVHLSLNDGASALRAARAASRLAPDVADVYLTLGEVQLAVGDFWEAQSSFLRAMTLDESTLDRVARLALGWSQRGHSEQGLALAEQLQNEFPSAPQGFAVEGDIFMATGRFGDAAEAYEHTARLSDDRVYALKAFTARWQAGERDAAAPLRAWLQEHPGDERINRVLENSARVL
ncbi:MAG: tetratricopeptide repeat protein [Pseudomonadota bacterium]